MTKRLRAKEKAFCMNYAVTNMSPADAYRAAYDHPEYTPKAAGTAASKMLHKPHIKAEIERLQGGIEEVVIEKKAEAIVDHQEEIRQHLREGLAIAKDEKDIDGIAKLSEMLGKMDACANFQETAPPIEPHSETNISIGLGDGMSPLQRLRDELKKDAKLVNGSAH